MNQYEIDYQQGYDTANDKWLDRIKQAKEEIDNLYRHYDNDYNTSDGEPMFKCKEVMNIIDKLIAESEDKYAY